MTVQKINPKQQKEEQNPSKPIDECGCQQKPPTSKQEIPQGNPYRPGSSKKPIDPKITDNRRKCNCKQQNEELIKCLRQHELFINLNCGKSKQSVKHRLVQLGKNIAAPSTLAPVIIHGFKRFELGMTPENDLEKHLFKAFKKMTVSQKDAFKKTVSEFEKVPDHVQHKIFNPKFVDLPIDNPLLLDEIVKELTSEIIKHGTFFEYPRSGTPVHHTSPGLQRPKTIGGPGDEFYPVALQTLQPTICKINGLRQFNFRPLPDRWNDEELIRECHVDSIGGESRVVCSDYRTVSDGCPTGSTESGVCLRVPEVRVGGTIDLTGFNFVSFDSRVRIRRRDARSEEWVVDAHVAGDLITPGEEIIGGEARIIADCRVEDHVVFMVPTLRDATNEFLPGDYEIRVEVPNPGSFYDLTSAGFGTPPEFLSSLWYFIKVLPRADIPYRISLDQVICDEETDGVGSDDVSIQFLVNGIRNGTPETFPTPDSWRNEDVDSGESFPENKILFSGAFPDILTIGILGFEVDDNAALREALMDFSAAFSYAIREIWEFLSPYLSGAGSAISSLVETVGAGWVVLAAGIAIVLTLGIAVLWALWAPPDPIMTDLIVIPAEYIYFLTHPRNPIPETFELGTFNGIKVFVIPDTKLENDYLEFRWYRSEDEDSTYRLRLRYTRI